MVIKAPSDLHQQVHSFNCNYGAHGLDDRTSTPGRGIQYLVQTGPWACLVCYTMGKASRPFTSIYLLRFRMRVRLHGVVLRSGTALHLLQQNHFYCPYRQKMDTCFSACTWIVQPTCDTSYLNLNPILTNITYL